MNVHIVQNVIIAGVMMMVGCGALCHAKRSVINMLDGQLNFTEFLNEFNAKEAVKKELHPMLFAKVNVNITVIHYATDTD